MYQISKEFALSYSHVLTGLPEGHQCARLHGHNAVVRVTCASHDLDDTGFVVDYGDLAPLKTFLDGTFDHRHLNDILADPTAENLCRYLYDWVQARYPQWGVVEVAWSETPKTWASYRP